MPKTKRAKQTTANLNHDDGLNVVTWNAASLFEGRYRGNLQDFFRDFDQSNNNCAFDLYLLTEHGRQQVHKSPSSQHLQVIQALRPTDWQLDFDCVIYYNSQRLEPIGEACYKVLQGGNEQVYEKNYSGCAVGQLFQDKRRNNDDDSLGLVIAISVHAGQYWKSRQARNKKTNPLEQIDLERIQQDLQRIQQLSQEIINANLDHFNGDANSQESTRIGKVIVGGDFNQMGKLQQDFHCRSAAYSPIPSEILWENNGGAATPSAEVIVRNSTIEQPTMVQEVFAIDRIFAAGPNVLEGDAGEVGPAYGSDHNCVFVRNI